MKKIWPMLFFPQIFSIFWQLKTGFQHECQWTSESKSNIHSQWLNTFFYLMLKKNLLFKRNEKKNPNRKSQAHFSWNILLTSKQKRDVAQNVLRIFFVVCANHRLYIPNVEKNLFGHLCDSIFIKLLTNKVLFFRNELLNFAI